MTPKEHEQVAALVEDAYREGASDYSHPYNCWRNSDSKLALDALLAEPKRCQWRDFPDVWETDCNCWIARHHDPDRFCPHCGRPVKLEVER